MLTQTMLPEGFFAPLRFLNTPLPPFPPPGGPNPPGPPGGGPPAPMSGGGGGKSPFANALSPASESRPMRGGRGMSFGSAIGVPSAGVNLSAFTGIAMASFTSCVTMVQVAVMPGRSFCSGFSAVITTVYVTTLLVVVGFRRTSCTAPLNDSPWNASTVNVAFWPCFTWPISASSMAAITFIWLRSFAMTNRVGVLMEAATVWPTSTARFRTTPSIGLLMVA